MIIGRMAHHACTVQFWMAQAPLSMPQPAETTMTDVDDIFNVAGQTTPQPGPIHVQASDYGGLDYLQLPDSGGSHYTLRGA